MKKKSQAEEDIEFDAAVRSLVEEGRAEIGPEPSPEELLAYQRGELSPEEADLFAERLAHHPDAVLLLAAFTREEEDEPLRGDPDYVSREKRESAWRALQRRLGRDGFSTDEEAVAAEAPRPWTEAPAWKTAAGWLHRAATAGAVVLVIIVYYTQDQRLDQLGGQVSRLSEQVPLFGPEFNPEQQILFPDVERRGDVLPAGQQISGTRGNHLVLALRPSPPYQDYRLEIATKDQGRVVWSRLGLEKSPDGSFQVHLPAGYLSAGRYELRLHGVDGGGAETLLATYSVEVPMSRSAPR